VEAALILWQS